MTLLADPENAKAYQTLCDHPRGSTRAWATKAGWTHSKMVRFLDALKRAGLGEVVKLPRGSLFRTVPNCSETFRNSGYPVSSAVVVETQIEKLPRYGASPKEEEQLRGAIKLVAELNRALAAKFDKGYSPIRLDNLGSIAAAKRILKTVPVDRAVALVWEAGMAFTPDKTGGDLPRSLGHPFITKYVCNEYRKIERALARGQLSLLFVESSKPPVVYGARKQEERPPAKPESLTAGVEAFRVLANSKAKPQRMG